MKLKTSFFLLPFLALSCNSGTSPKAETTDPNLLILQAENFTAGTSLTDTSRAEAVSLQAGEWLQYKLQVQRTGRYKVTLYGDGQEASLWLEDYVNNTDGRTYDITGKLRLEEGMTAVSVSGSPLDTGVHDIKLHLHQGQVKLDSISFKLIQAYQETPRVLQQSMQGEQWELVWSDEFEGSGLPDTTKWSYNIGNWGWGNNELQFYTANDTANARQQNGNLIIEARKNPETGEWTSARLTTKGRQAFLYGRVEFRAKVPPGRGAWAAGWLLGDQYRDEISWPYCGEIDVLECVGYEINDTTGKGINHATCHTRKYYFKQGNQIGSEIEVDSMNTRFHTYAMEWDSTEIRAYLDDEHYFTYDKNADILEWPFNQAQNIIVNVAVGGGWGGAKGLDSTWQKHQYVLDYIRVYQKK